MAEAASNTPEVPAGLGGSTATKEESQTTAANSPAASGDNNAAEADPVAIADILPPLDIPGGLPPSPAPLSPSTERNQAPGILDRRKSTRPGSSRSQSRGTKRGGKAAGGVPPIRISMADVGAEMKVKDGETPGNEEDTFEDAVDSATTPRPGSTEPVLVVEEERPAAAVNGLAIDGASEQAQSTVEVGQGGGAALDHVPEMLPPPRPDRASRDRSISPSKVTSGRQSPSKHMQGLSNDFIVNTPPPPSTADRINALEQRHVGERPPPPPAAAPVRKASSGFAGLLGRMSSIRKTARSPPAPKQESRFGPPRRDTTASILTVNTNAGGLASIPDGNEGTPRPSLKDQFESLRRQEEYTMSGANGHAPEDDAERTPIVRTQSDANVLSPTRASQDGRVRTERALSTPGLLKSPGLNPDLPPGTASGLTAGPADEPRPVNWDLWQQVVNEGPAAVQRTSGEQLREAIASGIPPAIRGVVWQVLAESKNEELEQVYRTLKARGTDAEQQQQQLKPAPMARTESQNIIGDNHSISSSRSSVHSDGSTPATSAMTSEPPSVEGLAPEVQAKLLAEKQKHESAALTKLEKAIRRDLGTRTSFSKYTQSAGLQDGLFGVCKAYALFDEGVGYAQGINFIAMPILFNMSETEAFTLLVRLMSKYDLRSMFTPEMAGLHLRLYQFERLLEDLEPALYCHLKRRHVGPQLYATQWFLTLFAYRFPLQLVLRVHDLVLSEGLTAILRFGIVLMQRNREVLLGMRDMSSLSTFLKEKLFDVYIDRSPSASSLLDSGFFGSVTGGADKELYRADELVRDACEINIPNDLLTLYTAEWEESSRIDRERSEELESLRTSNVLMTSRIRALEERTQQQDTEHVFIASDIVNLKISNDALLDENEGLKMKVEELHKIADAQPAEVEEKLKEEMDRIMQRNIEVQNENRGLKEEVGEMETELVNAKMMFAQVSESFS